jgi:hypothetical protein
MCVSVRVCLFAQIFLLTNSPYRFVDAGMEYLLGDYVRASGLQSWRHVFDVTIVKAKKPHFFARSGAFRKLDIRTGSLSLESVTGFERGEVYTEGSLEAFTKITGKAGHSVLYMGDHIFSDLQGPSSAAVWRTAAIIKEIGYETSKMSSKEFTTNLRKLLTVERLVTPRQAQQLLQRASALRLPSDLRPCHWLCDGLCCAQIRFGQRIDTTAATGDVEVKDSIENLKGQRNEIRKRLKVMFNEHFGSVFRTTSHRTNFYAELCRCADIYTASIDNFLHYPVS